MDMETGSLPLNGTANFLGGQGLRLLPQMEPEAIPSDLASMVRYIWHDDEPAAKNYKAMGEILAECGDLYRCPGYGNGLLLILPDRKHAKIRTGPDLAPIIVDRVLVTVCLDGKPKGSRISASHLAAMIRSESFLRAFQSIDQITSVPVYQPDFTLSMPGFNDGGPGHRILFTRDDSPMVHDRMDRINSFLDVMAFASNADRTNAVAGALTVQLRNHWPGGKPILLVTASKSHAGKDTVVLFASGETRQHSISYQATNWALERSFVGAITLSPDTGVVVVENARLDRRDRCIASAFLERFSTDPEPVLFSTGTGPAVQRRNDIVLAISTNFGNVSEDIHNRSLPIHLCPKGNVADRASPIGNPKLEYLPTHRSDIAAELRGMVERWKKAGRPLDHGVRHPFTVWAKTIGGILKANGFADFLANYGERKSQHDPVREALGLLGAVSPGDEWHSPSTWAKLVKELGLVKQVIPAGDQDNDESRKRGIGIVLTAHQDETFVVETDAETLTLRLERARRRFNGRSPHVRYRFVVLDRTAIAIDDTVPVD